ncbi:hypothetical protein [Amycolatopsis sp. NBC_00438]|uniref:hypothetical protein n=1 Tax=Amycolatopsis sp. NBC_00438 TaxID=2903558 RepID=UPI002E1ACD71
MVYVLCHGQVSGEDRFPYGRKGCRLGFYGRFGLGLSQTAGLDIIKNEEKPPSEHWYDFDLFPRDWQLPDLALTPLTADESETAREYLGDAYRHVHLLETPTKLSVLVAADGPLAGKLDDVRMVCCMSFPDHSHRRIRHTPSERRAGAAPGRGHADEVSQLENRIAERAEQDPVDAKAWFDSLLDGEKALLKHRPRIKAVAVAAKIAAIPLEDEDAPSWLQLISAIYHSNLEAVGWLHDLPVVRSKLTELTGLFRTWEGARRNCAALRKQEDRDAAKAIWHILDQSDASNIVATEKKCFRIARCATAVSASDTATWSEFASRYHLLNTRKKRAQAREWPQTEDAIRAMIGRARQEHDVAEFVSRLDFAYQEAVKFVLTNHNETLRRALSAPTAAVSRKRARQIGEDATPPAKYARTLDESEPPPAEPDLPSGFECIGPEPEWQADEQTRCPVCDRHCLLHGSLLAHDFVNLPTPCWSCGDQVETDLAAVQILCETTGRKYYLHSPCASSSL